MFCRRMRETQFSIDKRPAILILASLTTSIDSIENHLLKQDQDHLYLFTRMMINQISGS